MITKNHTKTTTVLVAIAALSAILVAGSVAASSNHSAFAHKKGLKNSGIAVPIITAQSPECKTAGGTSAISLSCTAVSTSTATQSGGVMGGP
jgi:hypothetical protein